MQTQRIITFPQMLSMREKVYSDAETRISYSQADKYYLPPELPLLNTLIQIPDEAPELQISGDRAEDDLQNAIKLYQYLGNLDRTQATDQRLWATLTHTTFWQYTQKKWPAGDKDADYIVTHWFERKGAGLGALRRNAISRLWWAAHLTVAPWENDHQLEHLKSSDRFKLTRVLLSQAQIFQDVLEREFGSNLRIRTLLLNSLSNHLESVSNKDKLSIEVGKRILLLLKHRHLDALPAVEAEEIIEGTVQKAVEMLNEKAKLTEQ